MEMLKLQISLVVIVALSLISSAIAENTTEPTIEFTIVPVAGAGPDSRGNIAGIVSGVKEPTKYRVVIYAHTDWWDVQPLTSNPFSGINSNGKWSNWTHLGHRYAAILVRPSFKPDPRTQALPSVGGDVIAKTEAPATYRPQ